MGAKSNSINKSPALPVQLARSVKQSTRIMLYVGAGGRCQFRGCNKDILLHELTQTKGIFGQTAHIYAFKHGGPRGDDPNRPKDIHDLSNLILLCQPCHKLIDDNPKDYPVAMLKEFKQEHEERISIVTSVAPEMRSAVVTLTAPIGGQHITIPEYHVRNAMLPYYPASPHGTVIDLSKLTGMRETKPFIEVAKDQIKTSIQGLFRTGGQMDKTPHLSIFGIAPISLLVFLGGCLSNKIPAELYQRHRDTEDWKWKTEGDPVKYEFRQLQTGSDGAPVALVLSLSGRVAIDSLPSEMQAAWVYELTLDGQTPNPTFLRQKMDLNAFRMAYQEALGVIAQTHGQVQSLHLFPAVPAPIAILCGRELLPKAHPKLKVYDFDHANNGFTFQLEVPT